MPSQNPEALLKSLRKLEGNKRCPNCGFYTEFGFGNVCVKFKTFVCDSCKSSHQAISHRVKSITMSTWTMDEVKDLSDEMSGGNDAARHTWLQRAPDYGCRYQGGKRPKEGDNIDIFKKFVIDCYEHNMFKADEPYAPKSRSRSSTPSVASLAASSSRSSPVKEISKNYSSSTVNDLLNYTNDSQPITRNTSNTDFFDTAIPVTTNNPLIDPFGTTTTTISSVKTNPSDIFQTSTKSTTDPFANDISFSSFISAKKSSEDEWGSFASSPLPAAVPAYKSSSNDLLGYNSINSPSPPTPITTTTTTSTPIPMVTKATTSHAFDPFANDLLHVQPAVNPVISQYAPNTNMNTSAPTTVFEFNDFQSSLPPPPPTSQVNPRPINTSTGSATSTASKGSIDAILDVLNRTSDTSTGNINSTIPLSSHHSSSAISSMGFENPVPVPLRPSTNVMQPPPIPMISPLMNNTMMMMSPSLQNIPGQQMQPPLPMMTATPMSTYGMPSMNSPTMMMSPNTSMYTSNNTNSNMNNIPYNSYSNTTMAPSSVAPGMMMSSMSSPTYPSVSSNTYPTTTTMNTSLYPPNIPMNMSNQQQYPNANQNAFTTTNQGNQSSKPSSAMNRQRDPFSGLGTFS